MIKITVDRLEPGMILAKPVLSTSGMILLGEGTELTPSLIERIKDMNVETTFIEGQVPPSLSKEEMVKQLDVRFRNVVDKPYMSILKAAVRYHIESLYE